MEPSNTAKKLGLNDRINKILATTQGKTYATAIATIFIVLLMVLFAVVPAYRSITDQIALNEKKSQYVDDVVEKQKALGLLVSQRNEQDVAITLLDIYLGNKINNELLVAAFSSLTDAEIFSDTTCVLESISFEEPKVTKNLEVIDPNHKAVGFTVTFKNCTIDYEKEIDNVKDMYLRILNFPVPVYISAVSYTKIDGQSSGVFGRLLYNKFDVIISGEYYFWPTTTTSTININE